MMSEPYTLAGWMCQPYEEHGKKLVYAVEPCTRSDVKVLWFETLKDAVQEIALLVDEYGPDSPLFDIAVRPRWVTLAEWEQIKARRPAP